MEASAPLRKTEGGSLAKGRQLKLVPKAILEGVAPIEEATRRTRYDDLEAAFPDIAEAAKTRAQQRIREGF